MSYVRRLKRVIRSHYHNFRSKTLTLTDGAYYTKYTVTHYTERCGWQEFGTKDASEYEHWRQEACGIVALQTVTNAIKPEHPEKLSIFEQIQDAIKNGAYLQYEKNAETISIGWIHDKLVAIAAKKQVRGYSANLTIPAMCRAIAEDKLIIASVYRPFVRFTHEEATRKKQGGHLVVVTGFAWENGQCTGLFVEDPYDINERLEPIDAKMFEDVYSGAAIVFYA